MESGKSGSHHLGKIESPSVLPGSVGAADPTGRASPETNSKQRSGGEARELWRRANKQRRSWRTDLTGEDRASGQRERRHQR